MDYFAELGELLAAEYRVAAAHERSHDGDLAFLRAVNRQQHALPVPELLNHVGDTSRMDLLVTLALAQHGDGVAGELTEALRSRLLQASPGSRRHTALLNLATEFNLDPLPLSDVLSFVDPSGDPSARDAALRHLLVLPPDPDEDFLSLADTLTDHHDLLVWAVTAHRRGHDRAVIEKALPEHRRDVLRFVPQQLEPSAPGATIMQQFPMWGPLDRPGEGDSGGLAVFLTSLGDALARQDGVARVVTIRLVHPRELLDAGTWMTPRGPSHHVLGIPAFHDGMSTASAAEPLGEIAWWLRVVLPMLEVVPDVAHVRFGSDVTLAVARTLKALDVRLVFTIAPDPHRMLLDLHHRNDGLDSDAFRGDLHRMFAADLLSEWADGAIALPNAQQQQETARFFPRVLQRGGPVDTIPEGITPWQPADGDAPAGRRLVEKLLARDGVSGLSPDNAGLPVLLNVGRWNRLKQQDLLVEAWLRSGLSKSTMLVLVGGSIAEPTEIERRMRERVVNLLGAAGSTVRGRFAWLPRQRNRDVRLLERALANHLPADSPHVYVCGSAKEEFGISVLEAMDAGLLAVAPRRGGASHYIRQGGNGFLADTSSLWGLAGDMSLILGGGWAAEQLTAIAAAGQRTVREEFTIDNSASGYARHYLRLRAARD